MVDGSGGFRHGRTGQPPRFAPAIFVGGAKLGGGRQEHIKKYIYLLRPEQSWAQDRTMCGELAYWRPLWLQAHLLVGEVACTDGLKPSPKSIRLRYNPESREAKRVQGEKKCRFTEKGRILQERA